MKTTLCFENIWNFSAPNANVTSLQSNGGIYVYHGVPYYAYTALGYPVAPLLSFTPPQYTSWST
ncbi:MAG: thermopsin [Candidatus Aramenus sp.]|nr:thermopsin [Candidatus Aramenus sp.]